MAKFIFVTGGVVSGLGKGITTASIGLLLKASGFTVDVIKFDPYLNIDPGTMSPYEHGEVYVLKDGAETDLDLGHYERFLDVNLNKDSSVTAGKIYDSILSKEREGLYLGKNVQLIPHVTNHIKEAFSKNLETNKDDNYIRLIEIGGSTGDFEGEVFMESFRQFKQANYKKVMHIHLGYVPFLKCSGEYKSKPLQNSIRQLLSNGLQPDVIVARYYPEDGLKISKEILKKIALFGNVSEDKVVSLPDLNTIYKVPVFLSKSNMKKILEDSTSKEISNQIPEFYNQIETYEYQQNSVKIGIIAKYPKLSDAYLSLLESLKIAGVKLGIQVEPVFIDAEMLTQQEQPAGTPTEGDKIHTLDGIIVPGGFGGRGMEGKIIATQIARTKKIPFLGICLGLQMAVVEFARNVVGLNAYSREMLESNIQQTSKVEKDVVVDYMPEQLNIYKKGGTMRLGNYDCYLEKNSLLEDLYQQLNFGQETKNGYKIIERHRHRLEVQNKFVSKLENLGFKVSGKHFYNIADGEEISKKDYLVELIELDKKSHPYFVATQSHPEFLSRPDNPHPLFYGLIKAAFEKSKENGPS